MGLFTGPGVTPSLKGNPSNRIALAGGECFLIQNAGWYCIRPGKYSAFQQYDAILGTWQTIGGSDPNSALFYVYSDGQNYRLANQTGCVVGALLTAGGTGFTSQPTVVAGSGNSLWRAVIGGAVSTSITVTNGGVNYTYPPIVLFSNPGANGVAATGYAVLTGSSVTSVVVTNQGGGYTSPPTITFTPDPREGLNNVSQGYNAAAVATLTGAGTITALLCIDHGSPVSGSTVPTLTISGGGGTGATAIAIMCWSITAYTVSATTAGSGYATPVIVQAYDNFPTNTPAYTNPTIQSGLVKDRNAFIVGNLSGTALTTTSQVVKDGGIFTSVPTVYASSFPAGATPAAAVLGATLGAVVDTSYYEPV